MTSKYGIKVQCPADIDSIKVQLQETQVEILKLIRKLIRKSAKRREEFDHKLAEIYALTGKTTAKKALKSIINAEQMKKVPVTWPSSDVEVDTVTHVDNPKESQHWKSLETPTEIVTYLKLHNRLHFGQAHGTPFM
eukprot:9090017-Ditylum_brightwellii.AAC.1